MTRQKIDTSTPHWKNYHAVATVRNVTIRIASWTCHKCKAKNETKLIPGKRRPSSCWKVEARCGRCHGTNVTLITADHYTIEPD